jgi:hypothetical protein
MYVHRTRVLLFQVVCEIMFYLYVHGYTRVYYHGTPSTMVATGSYHGSYHGTYHGTRVRTCISSRF